MKSHHFVMLFEKRFQQNIRVRMEPYFQWLYQIPVSADPNSSFSIINSDDYFVAHELINSGLGKNIGIDLAIEKSFSNGLFFLISGSLFDSKYKMNNEGNFHSTWFNTKFNSSFNTATSIGKEWVLSNDRLLEFGARIIYSEGMRYTPIDQNQSQQTGWPSDISDQAFEAQTPFHYGTDLRIAYRKNTAKRSWKLSLDIQNATNRENVRRPVYDQINQEIRFDPQSSLIPALSYTLDF